MKRFVFAVAAVALVACAGSAQETPVAPPVTAAPVVIGSAPVVEVAPVTVAPARRGLFGRLRNRGTTTMMVPATGTTVVTPGTVVTPPPAVVPSAPVPMPMPMPMPMPGTKTPSTMTVPTVPEGIVLASGTEMSGVVMPAMATTTMTMTAAPARRGLFGRLRNR